ncbi:hypothetical protein B0J13DRAFT_523198 [Dactylonectria estremocensis]|uniref:Uncharacterized protein n=1 Tax=Dactylonectria estremocensis TaxID=1079267 RepID=A0A9P9J989_9HYPO|nr:hypothetical protein B0J13DRAFT_523198 [Dactylonectria estremocensis]
MRSVPRFCTLRLGVWSATCSEHSIPTLRLLRPLTVRPTEPPELLGHGDGPPPISPTSHWTGRPALLIRPLPRLWCATPDNSIASYKIPEVELRSAAHAAQRRQAIFANAGRCWPSRQAGSHTDKLVLRTPKMEVAPKAESPGVEGRSWHGTAPVPNGRAAFRLRIASPKTSGRRFTKPPDSLGVILHHHQTWAAVANRLSLTALALRCADKPPTISRPLDAFPMPPRCLLRLPS